MLSDALKTSASETARTPKMPRSSAPTHPPDWGSLPPPAPQKYAQGPVISDLFTTTDPYQKTRSCIHHAWMCWCPTKINFMHQT